MKMRQRRSERGSAMLVTMILIGALLAGGAVLLSVQLSSNRSSDLTRSSMSALYCAEAGLSVARKAVAARYASWNSSMCTDVTGATCTEPAWLTTEIDLLASNHSVDGDTTPDFAAWIRDNGDEGAGIDDPQFDRDLQVFIVVRCTKYRDTPKQVEELVLFNGVSGCYPWQIGGCGGDNNNNGDAP